MRNTLPSVPITELPWTAHYYSIGSANNIPQVSFINWYWRDFVGSFILKNVIIKMTPGAIIGDGDRNNKTCAVPVMRDNFSILRTNWAIAWVTRAYMLWGVFAHAWYFWHTLQYVYMSVEILLQWFCRKLFQFEWSETLSNLVRSLCFHTTPL